MIAQFLPSRSGLGRCVRSAVPCVLVFFAIGCGGSRYTIDQESSERLADGLVHRELTLREGPWVVHVLELDLSRGDLEIRSVHAQDRVQGRERTSDMARRIQDSLGGVLGAINADFFSAGGETIGNQVSDGEVVRGTPERSVRADGVLRHRSHFGITAVGKPVIMRPELNARVSVDGGDWETITAVNVPNRGGLVLFNWYWGERTPVDSSSRAVMELGLRPAYQRGDTTVCVLDGPVGRGGDVPLDPGRFVLSAYGDSLWEEGEAFLFGDTVRVVLQWPPIREPLETLVGGTPRIVLRGQSVAGLEEYREGTAKAFTTDRHPRTGVGFSEDGALVVLVTVDGRQRRSVGMTLPEFADLMIMLGVAEGVNLDGGGSTTMVVGTSVVNRPSDLNGERAVGNALVVRRRGD